MAILRGPGHREQIGAGEYPVLLTNGLIERFEDHYPELGLYELFDRLMGRGPKPRTGHVRDIVALGLVGGGMPDRAADALVGDLGPEHNLPLFGVAQRLVGATLLPEVRDAAGKKKEAGSRASRSKGPGGMTPES